MYQTTAVVSSKTKRTASVHALFGFLLFLFYRNIPSPSCLGKPMDKDITPQFSQLKFISTQATSNPPKVGV